MENKLTVKKYIWQMVYSHTIAYCFAGFIGLSVYKELYARGVISSFMRSAEDSIVALGPFLQIFRGLMIALIILPVRKAFFEEKYGLLKLGLVVIGLSLFSTIGPVMGSFEGYIYSTIPIVYQTWGYAESIIYVLLFIGILKLSMLYGHKKIFTVVSIALMVLIGLIGVLGFMAAKGYISA
ncbi:MAG: hypothetical protein LBB62_04945 [Proteiniphilum sp.]|jgi:hypothetical protein|nr:hypothetical protein [Proteiniphilum sp.]